MGAAALPRQSEKNREYSITVQESLERVISLAEKAHELPANLAKPVGDKLEAIAKNYEMILTTPDTYEQALHILRTNLTQLAYEYKGHPVLDRPAKGIEALTELLDIAGGFTPYIPAEDADIVSTRYNHLRGHINVLLHGSAKAPIIFVQK